jgi:membrane protein implicated in regulation of membrane protease activity
MDIGEFVDVQHWKQDGTTQVKYRGANWQVSLQAGENHLAGKHQIVEVIGNRLVVKKF